MTARFEHGYALLIGVGRLANWDEESLPVTVDDVLEIKKVLVDPSRCAYPDNDDHIRLIHGEGATSTGILQGLEWLMERRDRDPKATAVVYFSGHGWEGKGTGEYFLIPHNVDPDDIDGSAIAFEVFANRIEMIPARRRLVVLDCCHAGAMTVGKGRSRRERPPGIKPTVPPKALLDRLSQGEGRAVFCSCKENERSWFQEDRSSGKILSLFTFHFREALKGDASRIGETEVIVTELMTHVSREVPRSAANQGKSQRPFFLLKGESFPVALLRAGKGLPLGGKFLRSISSTPYPGSEFGDYPELARAYLSPWSVYDRVKLDQFTGRKWLEDRLDDFLKRNDRGLFVVEAETGMGKTALLAHLARQRGYVHHFVDLEPGPNGVIPGIRNLASQLIRAWGLDPYLLDTVAPGLSVPHSFLQHLLELAADRRDLDSPDERIVLVVDALDEAGPSRDGQNVLGLPRWLSNGVYLVVSQRPVGVCLAIEAPRVVTGIDAQGRENLADMHVFLEAAADWPGIRKARDESESPVAKENFVATLLDKSQGVWIYLKYVLDEVEAGRRSPLNHDELPKGLWQYYARFWKKWKEINEEEWYSRDLPILSTLTAAQESLGLEDLISLAGVERSVLTRLRRVFNFEWSPYLEATSAGTGLQSTRSYRFYHASLREFFAGSIDHDDLVRAEEIFVDELAATTLLAHTRISNYFIRRCWGGLDEGLPALLDRAGSAGIDRYGLRHLAEHLDVAGRHEDLHHLLRLEHLVGEGTAGPVRAENAWFSAYMNINDTEGYLNDLGRAARLVRVAERPDVESSQIKACIGLGIRYALISSSLNSLARNIPPALIAALVEKGVWLPKQGLAYARLVPDPEQRALALIEVSAHLKGREKENALHGALNAVRGISDQEFQAQALAGLGPRLARMGYAEDALELVRNITIEDFRAPVLEELTPCLVELGRVDEALKLAREIEYEEARLQVLRALANQLADLGRVEEALEVVEGIECEESRGWVLVGLVPRVAELGHVDQALELAREIDIEPLRDRALLALAPQLAKRGGADEVLRLARSIRLDAPDRSYVLAALVPILSDLGLAEESLALAQGIAIEWLRARVLAELGHVNEALKFTRGIPDQQLRARSLARLAPYLAQPRHLNEALELTWGIADQRLQFHVLSALGPRLVELGHVNRALELARGILDERFRSLALAELRRTDEAHRPALEIEIKIVRHRVRALWELGREDEATEWINALAMVHIEKLRRTLNEMLDLALNIEDRWARAWALSILAPRVVKLPLAKIVPIWEEGLQFTAKRSRSDLLAYLGAFAPVIAALGGSEAVDEACRAIEDVGRWWP